MKKFYFPLLGLITGFANGLFGSGGGIIAVPMLQRGGLSPKHAHATSLSLTLPLSIISVMLYSLNKDFSWEDTWPLIPAGLAGAALGCFFLKRIPDRLLRRVFGVFLVIAGARMLLA